MTTPSYEQIVNSGFLYVNGFGLNRASATTLTLATGQCRDSTNVFDILSSSALTLNISVNGVNGLDTGTVAANKNYSVYVIWDITNNNAVAGLISLSTSNPVLPGGYGAFRRIGSWPTNGSSQFYVGYQLGSGSGKQFFFDAPVSALAGGSATSFTAVDLSATVPAFSPVEVMLNAQYTPNTAGNTFSLRPTGSSVAANASPVIGSGVVAAKAQDFPPFRMVALVASGKPEVDYVVQTSDALTLLVAGYIDQL